MKSGMVRIIGGKWRGRKLKFPAIEGLRPTPDRVRETLFNWLAPVIIDTRCLDLFAGSGALGIEALSRGAAHVTFVDQNPEIVAYLRQQLTLLNTDNAKIYCAKLTSSFVPPFEKGGLGGIFNLIFLDPPFHQNLIQTTCTWLAENKLLTNDAYIYIEAEATLDPLPVPAHWEILKSKIAGQVGYHLLQVRL